MDARTFTRIVGLIGCVIGWLSIPAAVLASRIDEYVSLALQGDLSQAKGLFETIEDTTLSGPNAAMRGSPSFEISPSSCSAGTLLRMNLGGAPSRRTRFTEKP
jgi:hypothetical protein